MAELGNDVIEQRRLPGYRANNHASAAASCDTQLQQDAIRNTLKYCKRQTYY